MVGILMFIIIVIGTAHRLVALKVNKKRVILHDNTKSTDYA